MGSNSCSVGRRRFLASAAVGIAGSIAACSQAAPPAATSAPPKTAPTPAVTQAPPPQPTAAPAKPTPEPPKAPAVSKTPVKWRHAMTAPKLSNSLPLLGTELGYYREVGLELEIVTATSDVNNLKALLAGELDTANITPSASFAAIETGATVKVVGADLKASTFIFIARKTINSFAELAGKSAGISQPGALPDVIIRAVLIREKIDPEKVTFAQIGANDAILQALVAGKIDFGIGPNDYVPIVEADPNLHVLGNVRDVLPYELQQSFVTSDKIIKERGEDLYRFLLASARGVRYMLSNRDSTLTMMAKFTGSDIKALGSAYDWYIKNDIFSPDLAVAPEALMWMQELNVKLGSQKAVQPIEKVASFDLQKRVVAELGAWKR